MKVGDIIQIIGNYGFQTDPVFKVIGIKGQLITLQDPDIENKKEAMFSWQNTSLIGRDMLEKKGYKVLKEL
jgi:hypothetical protein